MHRQVVIAPTVYGIETMVKAVKHLDDKAEEQSDDEVRTSLA